MTAQKSKADCATHQTTNKLPRISFGMIVLNGLPFVSYNLRALYPFAHRIIAVEYHPIDTQ
ncbi:hypothetical protein ACFLYO_05490 [Chloroflexota bacterium]